MNHSISSSARRSAGSEAGMAGAANSVAAEFEKIKVAVAGVEVTLGELQAKFGQAFRRCSAARNQPPPWPSNLNY